MIDLEQRCIEAGLKMTGPRKVILKVLKAAKDHPSVDTVYERAKVLDNTMSIATVYRTLSTLEELDIIARREFNESFARYEANMDHHHHLIDVETGKVVEFENQALEKIKIKIAEELGYELVDHRLELYGRKLKKK